jgi:hypothetical protein
VVYDAHKSVLPENVVSIDSIVAAEGVEVETTLLL